MDGPLCCKTSTLTFSSELCSQVTVSYSISFWLERKDAQKS